MPYVRDPGPGVPQSPSFTAFDVGLSAATVDPAACSIVGGQPFSSGFIVLNKMYVTRTAAVTKLQAYVVTAGSGLTSGRCFGGLYDYNGNLLGVTADQAAVWNSTGLKTMTMTARPGKSLTLSGDILTSGWYTGTPWYWGAILAVGSTVPKFASTATGTMAPHPGYCNGAGLYAATVPGALHRLGYESLGGYTSLPDSLSGLTITDSGWTWRSFMGIL